MSKKEKTEKKQKNKGFLEFVEKVGNTLPHPATLFALFAVIVIIASWLASVIQLQVEHPGTGDIIKPVNLLSEQGLHLMLEKMVVNFTSFAPLGTVLVAMLGIGIAEGSGLIGTTLRLMVLSSPKRLLTFVIVFSGILSNLASEVGYVLMVPLGGMIFLAVGRHPIAGLAAAFAGVSGGYSANLLLGTIDPLLAGLSQEAARIIDPGYVVNPAANYYFMLASTLFIALAGTWATEKIVIPRLGVYEGDEKPEEIRKLDKSEKKGLAYAGVAAVIITAAILAGTVFDDGFLRDPETGSLLRSPFMEGIVAIIFLGAGFLGTAYGIGAGTFKNDSDLIKGMGKSMETLAIYIVLVFFAAQFVAYFKWTNLGLIFAIKGAQVLEASGLGPIPLIITFTILAGISNMFMGSASAKWAIMAPVFIPMFMLLGFTPELIQAAYRVGDSVTNIISPMMSYFALIVAFVGKYDKNAGIGTVIATMLPYTIAFWVTWVLILTIWFILGLPVGPEAGLFLNGG